MTIAELRTGTAAGKARNPATNGKADGEDRPWSSPFFPNVPSLSLRIGFRVNVYLAALLNAYPDIPRRATISPNGGGLPYPGRCGRRPRRATFLQLLRCTSTSGMGDVAIRLRNAHHGQNRLQHTVKVPPVHRLKKVCAWGNPATNSGPLRMRWGNQRASLSL